jgi:hypothetical protein
LHCPIYVLGLTGLLSAEWLCRHMMLLPLLLLRSLLLVMLLLRLLLLKLLWLALVRSWRNLLR